GRSVDRPAALAARGRSADHATVSDQNDLQNPLGPADGAATGMEGALSACVSRMRATSSVGAGARVLRQAGEVIGLPRVAVIHDISLPHGPNDEEGAKLAEIFGWPDDYTAHWETRGNTFHDPLSLRCRSEHLPFYWPGPAPPRRRPRQRLPS